MIDNSQFRFFSFWFATIANGGDLRQVKLEDKENYIFTRNCAIEHGKIQEDYGLSNKVAEIYYSKVNFNLDKHETS
jgi:predicted solute-binding protein